MASFDPSVKVVNAATAISVDTKANWEGFTQVLPAGLYLMESDTGFVKLTDGEKAYTALPYLFNAKTGAMGDGTGFVFTQAYKDLLDKANTADGVAKLDETGKLPTSILPDGLVGALTGVVHYVATYADLPAYTGDASVEGLYVVMDASGDSSVTAGSAGYVYRKENEGATGAAGWVKIFESESMDLDFSATLANYFNKTTNTLDDITDGTTYIKMEKTWKETVGDWMAHAIRDDDKVFIKNPDVAGYTGMMASGV